MEPLGETGYLIDIDNLDYPGYLIDIDNLDEIQKRDQFVVKITLQGVLMENNVNGNVEM